MQHCSTLERVVRANLSADTAAMPDLRFDFVSLAFDTLGASFERIVTAKQYYALQISMRSVSTGACVANRIWQKVSFVVWSSVAAAMIARIPLPADTQSQ